MKGSRFTAGLLLSLAIFSGCSSSSATRDADTAMGANARASETLLLIDDRGLVASSFDEARSGTNVKTRTAETLEPGLLFGGDSWPSPDGKRTALTVHRGETTHLALVGSDGTYRDLHNVSGDAHYSVAWAPSSDSLLIGFGNSANHGIAVYAVGPDNLSDVGCSASSLALSWGHGDWFVVGDPDNHYVVERSGCGTIESVDARKFHEVTFGPKGDRVAYILRELVYDSQAREYRPDSSLYVAKAVGTDPVLVAGNRYRPRRPEWSADAMSLAFDARLPENTDRRLISIYDVESGISAFLNPKAVDSKSSEWAPHWSPSGNAIAYQHSPKGKPPVVSVRVLSNSFSSTVGKVGERFSSWLDDDRLILKSELGIRIVRTDGKGTLVLEDATYVIRLSEKPVEAPN